jgi:K+-sensing histidine kinase KdpD
MFTAIRKTSAWPLPVQFACTIAIILSAFALEFPLEEKGFGTPFTLFLTCVCMVTVLFGRRAGFLAVALSAPLGALFFRPVGTLQLTRAFDLFQIECYVALAVGAILVVDEVRRALVQASEKNEKLEEESGQKTLRLREAAHRWPTTLPRSMRSSARGPWLPRILRFSSRSSRQAASFTSSPG